MLPWSYFSIIFVIDFFNASSSNQRMCPIRVRLYFSASDAQSVQHVIVECVIHKAPGGFAGLRRLDAATSRHVIGEKKLSDTFFGMHNLSQLGVWGGAVSPPAGSGAEPRKQTHIGNNLLNIVVLLYNFIIIYLYNIGAQNSCIYLYNIGAQNSWFFLEVTQQNEKLGIASADWATRAARDQNWS